MPDQLALIAQDAEDLEVIAAYLQDAALKVKDIAYLPKRRRFALVMNRFAWEETRGKREAFHRLRTGLSFDNVEQVEARNVSQDRPDGVLSLLTIRFEPLEAPGGLVRLVFSGNAEIRLTVEALDAQMKDMGLGREALGKPEHDLS